MARIEDGVGFPITATDHFSGAFDKLKSKAQEASGVGERMGAVWRAAFVGISGAGLAGVVQRIIDLGDEAYKSAQKVGVTTEAYQQLSYAAKLAGLETAALHVGLKTLSTQALAAADGGKEAQEMFRRLGVSATDANGKVKPTEALLLAVAERFKDMPDGVSKSAMAVKLFGKSGIEMIPFLNQGRDGIKALMEEAGKLGVVMDHDTAAGAERLNDNIERLKTGTLGFLVQAVKPLLPFLEMMSERMVDARKSSDELANGGNFLTTVLRLVASGAIIVKAVFEGVGKTLGALVAAAVAFTSGRWGEAALIFKDAVTDIDVTKRAVADLGAVWSDNVAPSVQKTTKLTRELGAATKDNAGEQKKMSDAILRSAAALEKFQQDRLAAIEKLREVNRDEVANIEDQAVASGMLAEQGEIYLAQQKLSKKLHEELAKLTDDQMSTMGDQIVAALNQLDIDKSRVAEAIKLKNRNEETAKAQEKAADAMRDELKRQAEDVKKMSESITDSITDALMRGFEGGKGFVKNFIDTLKNMFKSLVLRPIIQPVAQSMSSGIMGMLGMGGGPGAGVPSGGGIGDVISGISGLFSGGAGTGFAGSVMGGIGGGVTGIGNMLGSTTLANFGMGMQGSAAAALGGAGGTAAAGMGSMLAAAGPYIAAAMAIYAIAQALKKPKDGGSFMQSFSSSGASLGNLAVPGSDNGRYYTPSGQDAQAQQLGQGMAQGYFAALKGLGGTAAGNVAFGIGFDTDPKGTADNRISSGVMVNGRRVFGSQDRAVGRDAERLGSELQVEAQRAILAALQASDLPEHVSRFLQSINVNTATVEEIQAAISGATAINEIMARVNASDPFGELARALEEAQQPMLTASRRSREAMESAITGFDGTTAGLQALTAASSEYYTSQINMLAAIRQVRTGIDEMFGTTSRNIMLAGMDDQGKYNFLQSEADKLMEQALGSNDATQIQKLAEKINNNINAAFGLLSPEEQARMSGQFLKDLEEARAKLDDKLKSIETEESSKISETMKGIADVLEKYFSTQQTAAADISNAAGQIATSVSAGIGVNLHIDVNDDRVAVREAGG